MLLRELLEEKTQIDKNKTYEIKDIVEFFPKGKEKLLQKFWGMDGGLTYKGQLLFTKNDLGPAYEGVIKAGEDYINDPDKFYVMVFDKLEVNASDAQESYLGYDPKDDTLWVGFDVWLDEESFNQEFDKKYPREDVEGEVFKEAWEEFKKSFTGVLLPLKSKDGKKFKVIESKTIERPGGFYKGIYNRNETKKLGLIDLRLD